VDEKALIEHLKETNSEFRRLMEQHLQYEQQLEVLNKLRFLTSEQEMEKKRVQKVKLRGKDRMAEILRECKVHLSQ
jgi:hypothetical protein